MNTVEMKKDALVEQIQENMRDHRATYEKAVEVYEARQIEVLADLLRKAERGKPFDRLALSRMPVPEDHTEDYKVALEMLHYEVNDTVTLSDYDFRRYVRDEWEWAKSFFANTTSYTVS